MFDLRGIEYILFAGIAAIAGLLVCAVVLFPISLFWPPVWGAAIWVVGGFVIAGLFMASQVG